LQVSLEETAEEEVEEETTSPMEGKAAASRPEESHPKRLRQTDLESGVALQRLLGAAMKAGERVGPGVKMLPTVK
jgi:hypothetical protein